ncbi:restriction endonuclease [Roseomonas sp. GC11]|uniref:BglII/BstYI family type II restriction endonuclease n=1 Tax=Roseomonas sp. GC11 TaxID=2950546 RepID=UPI00210CF3C1|nr:BglII/BstYI family type II restriction endonuclease [Roseomonas sp. GC11]MCQ4160839.1 restriction endonuclease [Roseomonas sp. GC11]
MSDATAETSDLEEEVAREEVASTPNESADPQALVDAAIPQDIRDKYEIFSYRSAAVILSQSHPAEFAELMETLRAFTITQRMIRIAGGNESDIPKLLTARLRPLGWHETIVQGDLLVRRIWKEQVRTTRGGKAVFEKRETTSTRPKFLDGHKIDYVKGKVAFDLEWNSKDQTFDRDLYAFAAFATCGVVDVGVLVTRGVSLNPVFRQLGPALKKDGTTEYKANGEERPTADKYGASTTWMGKLLYRLNAGRNAGCPVLAIGITPACIGDWP